MFSRLFSLLLAALLLGCMTQPCFARPQLPAALVPVHVETGDGKEGKEKDDDDDDEEEEKGKQRGKSKLNKDGLKQLPAEVKTAAEGAVKGLVLTGASKTTRDGKTNYSVSGTAAGKTFIVDVSAEGKVLKVAESGGGGKGDDDDEEEEHHEKRKRRSGRDAKKSKDD